MAGTRAKAPQRCAILECSSLPTKVRLLMVQTFIYSAVMYGAEVWTRRRRSKTRCQRS
jgi:hypothetical protein